MMPHSINKKILALFVAAFVFFSWPILVKAETVNVDASKLLSHVEISISPRSGSFEEHSTFQVPIYINTKGQSVNGIEVRLNFDKNKLSIINPTGGTSIIGIWTEPPRYDNTNGTASYVGVVPGGITTASGLVGTVTFKAIAPGKATLLIASNSRILLNDGLGTSAQIDAGRAEYSILTKAPEGVQIYSETHPIQSDWYNNNSPVLSWVKDAGVDGFSYTIDNKPNTIPENILGGDETTKSFEDLDDGLWYFHIKANKSGVWGTTGHFLVRVDTTPPAEFKIEANYLVAAVISGERTLVSFFTTDNLSGIDHYEVGIIDKNQPATESPVFVQSESPFQVPLGIGGKLEVVVRAVDKAGNVRDESIDVREGNGTLGFFQKYPIYILLSIIFLGLFLFLFHFLVGHHVIAHTRQVWQLIRKDEKLESTIPPPPDIHNE